MARRRRATGGCLLLFGEELLEAQPVMGPDFVAEIIEQFEDGERLLGDQWAGMAKSIWRNSGVFMARLWLVVWRHGVAGRVVRCVPWLP